MAVEAQSVLAALVGEELRRMLTEGSLMFVYLPGFGDKPVTVTPLQFQPARPVPRPIAPSPTPQQPTIARAIDPMMTLKTAAPLFQRRQRLAKATRKRNEDYWERLLERFGKKRLCDITADQLWEYQEARQEVAGAVTINHEISQLKQLLTSAGLWANLRESYRRLKERPSTVGRALMAQQERRLFAAAKDREEWRVAYLVALLAAHTLLSPSEIYALKLEDPDLERKIVRIRAGKNAYRPREVPLNRYALYAVRSLLRRAREECGASLGSHFLLPYRGRFGKKWDPTQPTRGCRSAWRSLTRSVGMRGLRIKDMRHHGTTVLDEHGVSDRVQKELLGHSPNSKIINTYSHPRIQARRKAVKILERKRA